MGRYLFHLPDIGEGIAEAEIVVWHVSPGDVVDEDQSIVDVMTDKATVDMTAPVAGVVTAIHGEVGALVPVGSVLFELEIEGEGNAPDGDKTAPVTAGTIAPPPVTVEPEPAAPSPGPSASVSSPPSARSSMPGLFTRAPGTDPVAAPATRRRAHELGIALQYVPGSGPEGRITPADLDAYIASGGANPPPVQGLAHRERKGSSETRIIGMRRRIAERMQDAKRRIPHISYVDECDITELEALRADLNANLPEGQGRLTLLPFLMRALARVLPDFPQINAHYDDDAGVLRTFDGVHVGIATQTPSGLMVPVVRHVEARDLWDCADELRRVTAAARDGSASRETLSGSTITITSLGALGGIATTPIINHPEVAIIGPNKLVEKPVVQGAFVSVRKCMNISSSFDHRIIDGYDAALFLQAFKRMLEHPALIFMD